MDTSLNRSGLTQELNITKFTDDGDDSRIEESQFETFLITNNTYLKLMYEGLDYLSAQKFPEAIKSFSSCIAYLKTTKENPSSLNYNLSLMHCNIALCHFYMGNLRDTEVSLNDAKMALDFKPNSKNENSQLLYLKILCNFCVLYIKIKHFDNVQKILKMIKDFIRSETDPQKRANFVSHVIYVLFRAESLTHYSPDKTEFNQQDVSSTSYGIYLMIIGLNYEFTNQNEKASEEFFKAFEHWRNQGDEIMCLIVLRHLKHLYEDNPSTYARIDSMYRSQMAESDLSEGSLEEIFEAFEIKLQAVQEISKSLQSLEQLNISSIANNKRKNDIELTKLSLKLNIKSSVALARQLIRQNADPARVQQLQESINYMDRTMAMLETENSQAMINLLSNHPYVHNSINRLKSSLSAISSGFSKFVFRRPFEQIKSRANARPAVYKPQTMIGGVISRIPVTESIARPRPGIPFNMNQFPVQTPMTYSVLSQKARETVNTGDYLTKLNYTSNGSLKKFFRVFNNSSIRWAKKPAYLTNMRNCHSYEFSEIRGIVYGKCTTTFLRSKNRQLEPWLCFSLILKSRPLDVYIEEEKIDRWYIGLGEYIKQNNPNSYVLTKGKYYWRKFAFVIKYVVMLQIPEKMKGGLKKSFSLCKAIILYGVLINNASKAKEQKQVKSYKGI